MMIWDNFYFLHTILQALEDTQEFFPSVFPCTAMGKVKGKNLIFNQKKRTFNLKASKIYQILLFCGHSESSISKALLIYFC